MLVRDIQDKLDLDNVMVVSPDVGGVVRARALAKRINAPLAIVDKRRERAGESEVMNIIGDVKARAASSSTTSSIPAAPCATPPRRCWRGRERRARLHHPRRALGRRGARISASKLKELVITDSIQSTEAVRVARNIRTVSIAPLIGEAIDRTAKEESVSSLFN